MAIFKGDQPEKLKSLLTYALPFVLFAAVVYGAYWLLWSERSGSISVASSIPGAEVLINSSPTNQKTPVIIKRLPADSYEISVRMEGYIPSPEFQLIQVAKGSRIAVSFGMISDSSAGQSLELITASSDSMSEPVTKTWIPTLDSLKKIRQHQKTSHHQQQTQPTSRRDNEDLNTAVFASVEVTSSLDGALILLDNVSTGFYTPNNLILNRGAHLIKVQKEGYQPDPEMFEIVVAHSGQRNQAHFNLSEQSESDDNWALTIRTENVEGAIYLDDRFCAVGEYQIKDLPYGQYLVSFGSVDEYNTPESQKIFITQESPVADVVGVYHPIIYMMAALNSDGGLLKNGIHDVIGGVYFQENGFTEDNVRGPAIKYLEGNEFYAWELGYGYAERNPPGMDCIQFLFKLSKGFNRDTPVRMLVYGYASNHNYPFSFRNKTEIALYLNDSGIHTTFHPSFNLEEEQPLGYDVFDVTRFLEEGDNTLMIRTTENSRCFFYLNKIVLL